ncbi:hypothetical protein DL93DRAFT_1598663 [Clavulina sp. PMI_390]|nr:hypothetical protein DL93DRAFT_1598663 [Clavulina sp. PMI_390]
MNIRGGSIDVQAQEAKNIRRLWFRDRFAINALSFSPESLSVFTPEYCGAKLNKFEDTMGEPPAYFLQARSIDLHGISYPIKPLISSHLTTLRLTGASEFAIEQCLRISNLPRLTSLHLARSVSRRHGNNFPAAPFIMYSVERLELINCENEFAKSLFRRVTFPQLTFLFITQTSWESFEPRVLEITPLLDCTPLLSKLSLCMTSLPETLQVLNHISSGSSPSILPKLRSLEIRVHESQYHTELTSQNLDRLQVWVEKRLQAGILASLGVSPLESLRLSEDFLGVHRAGDWWPCLRGTRAS